MSWPVRRLRFPGLLLAAACLAGSTAPAWALGGTNTGSNLDCGQSSSPQAIVQYAALTQISGSGGVACAPPGGDNHQAFGPGSPPGVPPATPQVGTPCHFDYLAPARFRMDATSASATYNFADLSPSGNGNGPAWSSSPFQDLAALVSRGHSAQDLYTQAGTADFLVPWAFDGVWTRQGPQVNCVAQNAAQGWSTPCRLNGTGTFPMCMQMVVQTVLGSANAVSPPVINLNAFLTGTLTGGQVTSLPARPHPGLTNLPTCFYVSGMLVNNQPANPQQDQYWEQIVPGPPDGKGRRVFYVFVIHVAYQATVWTFGDGTTASVLRGGASPEPVPAACPTIANQQFLVAHTYQRYSTGDGFHVTVTHQYGVDMSELWIDSRGTNGPFPLPPIPPVTVAAQPQPYYAMQIVQEEGIPIGQ